MRVTNALHIDAAPDVVWAVTRDIERWPEWTPTVTAVRLVDGGELAVGSVARIRQPMQPESDWIVTELEPGRRFAWETRRPGLRMLGRHEIEPEGAGTRNILTVEAGGALAVLLWPVLRLAMRKALADENRGLRDRCERKVPA
jgi:hypothetical protein